MRAQQNGKLVLKNEASVSGILENGLFMTQRAGLRAIQVAVTLTEVEPPPEGAVNTNSARLLYTLYNDGTPGGGVAGDVVADLELGMGPGSSQVTAFFQIFHCRNPSCSTARFLQGTFGAVADPSGAHVLGIAWDGGTTVRFSLDGASATLDPTQLGAVSRDPVGGYTGLTVVGVSKSAAQFDNVLVDRVRPDGRPCKSEPTDEAIQYGDLISCDINPVGDTDIFRFVGGPNDRVTIRAARTGGSLDPCIQLYGPDGVLVSSACNVSNANRLDVSLAQAGTHAILISDAGNKAPGTYDLALERIFPLSRFGSPIKYGQTLSNQTIDPPGDLDVFLLDGTNGNKISIQATRTDGSFEPCIQLYGPDGALVSTACDLVNVNRIDVSLIQDGTHTLLVSDVGSNDTGAYSVSLQCLIGTCTDTRPTSLVASVLPSSRSVQVGTPATAFATIINTGSVATSLEQTDTDGTNGENALSCVITQLTGVPTPFTFQATDPTTNLPIGAQSAAVNITPGSNQTFVISLTPTAAFCPSDIQFGFTCTNTGLAPIVIGLNTLLISASPTAVPDIIALAATVRDDGIVSMPGPAGTGIFAVATTNVGADGTITVSADTGDASLPTTIFICETSPATGACLAAPASTVTRMMNRNDTPAFGIFVNGSGTVRFDPAANRVFVRFKEDVTCGTVSGSVTRGSTSVAVRTQ